MLRLSVILILLLPFTCFAQYVITGKIVNSTDKKSVANASVFLNNAIAGTTSTENGDFKLTNVRPGQYDLVVSVVGYETFHKDIMVTGDMSLPAIEISPKTIQLKEVKIGPNRNWDRDYATFKRFFLGTSANVEQCKILNPQLLDFDYESGTRTFSATSSDFLVIENKALGYRIRYLLTELTNDYVTGVLFYEGSAAFEEMKGSKSQELRWQKKRLEAYKGSSMHFLRSTINNTITKEGFKVFRLIREPNPKYKNGADNKYFQTMYTKPLSVFDFMSKTNVKGQFGIGFKDCLYIVYNPKAINDKEAKVATTTDVPDYLTDDYSTIITFAELYAFYDNNGIIINPKSLLFEGGWGKNRIPELLPVDYVPVEVK